MAQLGGDLLNWAESVLAVGGEHAWTLVESGYDPSREAGIEARFTISNGFMGIRGARSVSRGPIWASWLHGLNWASWPRIYIAGLFDTPDTLPPVPALVPGPDWLRLRVEIDGQPLLIRSGEVVRHRRTLDLKRGLVVSSWDHREPAGHVVRLRVLRLVSLACRELGLQVAELRVDGGECDLTLHALVDTAGCGLEPMRLEPDVTVWRTASSDKVLALAQDCAIQCGAAPLSPIAAEPLRQTWSWRLTPDEPTLFTRLVGFARGDLANADVVADRARTVVAEQRARPWRRVLDAHEAAWTARWQVSDVQIDGDDAAQQAVRFAIYQLISACNPEDERVSIGARALTGDAYLGHVFWDTEIYLLPFYTLTWPEAARALLMYRYHTLDGARRKAARLGYAGALYAWESADTGDEVTPEEVLDPSGRAVKILCGLEEQHISADVAYAVWQYWQATGDDDFMASAGAEIIVDTARFWASRAIREADGAYHIRRIIGPDEYHETVDDNAYTNVMAACNLERGRDAAAWLSANHPHAHAALVQRLALTDDEVASWADVAQGLVTGFDPATGLFEQFEGYFGLEEIPREVFSAGDEPADVALGRARVQGSQVLKQADVVALLALLPERFEPEVHKANFAYYEPRCAHGSSLSRGLHAVVAARLGDADMAHRYFHSTAAIDLSETLAASAGGIHIAAQGALWQAAVFGMGGLRLDGEGLALSPNLPRHWNALTFAVRWRGRLLRVEIERDPCSVTLSLVAGAACSVRVGAAKIELEPDRSQRVARE